MSQVGRTFLFFMKSPDLSKLLNFSAEISCDDQRKGLHIFHRRVLKCRELVFSESTLVATPSVFSRTEITGIIDRRRFYDADFQEKLNKMGLKVIKIGDASPIVLQECLQYTIAAKLAPQWNIVQNLLVQGRDFLMVSDPLRAIKLDIFVSGNEIILSVVPKCIKLPHFKVESYLKLYNFSGNVISIRENCHVLPSLKKAKAVLLSKTFLKTSMFKNYSEFKKHWKNMYGYRLPDIPEEDIWYLNIEFNIPFSTSYTYPSFCIRPFAMTDVPRVDPYLTIQSFISDFCKKVDNVCKEKCQILDHKASFPSLKLHRIEDTRKDILPRPGTTYTMVQNVSYRSSAVVRRNNETFMNNVQQQTKRFPANLPSQANGSDLNLFSANSHRKSIGEKNVIVYANDFHNLTRKPCAGKYQDEFKNASVKSKNNFSSRNKLNDVNITNNNLLNSTKCNDNDCEMVLIGNQVKIRESNSEIHKKYAPIFFPKKSKLDSSKSFHEDHKHFEDKKKSQAKYAPTFFPKKPNKNVQNLTLPDIYPKIKSSKRTQKFSVVKDKHSEQQDRNLNGMEIQQPNLNSDVLNVSPVVLVSKITTVGNSEIPFALGNENRQNDDQECREHTSSKKKRVQNQQNPSKNRKAKKIQS